MVRHALSVEVTVRDGREDGADELLDAVVRAVRQRLSAGASPIALASGEGALVELHGTRWSRQRVRRVDRRPWRGDLPVRRIGGPTGPTLAGRTDLGAFRCVRLSRFKAGGVTK